MFSNKGLTIIEVVVSGVIFVIVILGAFNLFPAGARAVNRAKEQVVAVNLAQEKIEQIRNISYENISSGSFTLSPPYRNNTFSDSASQDSVAFSRIVTIEPVDDARDGIGGADDDADADDYKKIGVIIQWRSGGKDHEAQLSTVLTKR